MSYAIARFPSAAETGLAHLSRALLVAVVLAALGIVGMSMLGHSDSVAASSEAMAGRATMAPWTATQTDPSVPDASEVFAAAAPATEEACPTF